MFAAHTAENDDWQRRRRTLLQAAHAEEPGPENSTVGADTNSISDRAGEGPHEAGEVHRGQEAEEPGSGAEGSRKGAVDRRVEGGWADRQRRNWGLLQGSTAAAMEGEGKEGTVEGAWSEGPLLLRNLKYDIDEALTADATSGKRCGETTGVPKANVLLILCFRVQRGERHWCWCFHRRFLLLGLLRCACFGR